MCQVLYDHSLGVTPSSLWSCLQVYFHWKDEESELEKSLVICLGSLRWHRGLKRGLSKSSTSLIHEWTHTLIQTTFTDEFPVKPLQNGPHSILTYTITCLCRMEWMVKSWNRKKSSRISNPEFTLTLLFFSLTHLYCSPFLRTTWIWYLSNFLAGTIFFYQ